MLQAEEIRAVLLRKYQDTGDPDQRPYCGPSPVFADLMDNVIESEASHLPLAGAEVETLPIPYNGLRSR